MSLCRALLNANKIVRINKASFSVYFLPREKSPVCLIGCYGYHTSGVLHKRRKTAEERKSAKIIEYSPKPKAEVIDVWRDITVKELAQILNQDIKYVSDIFLNEVRGANTIISDLQKLQEAIRRSGRRARIVAKPVDVIKDLEEQDIFPRPPPDRSELKPRPPVVTVMGHVDHGKTTLLDALRNTHVVDQEFGGITQHTGAFSVVVGSGARITFLDTPGHAAFTSMRERGANVTDIVVLVVAADDGVMEQTLESVRMAKDAKVPILVAINKIDSPKADVDRAQRMLVEAGVQVETLGGDTQSVAISALKKQNLDQLVEALVLQADLLEIGGDPTGLVEAVVIESRAHQHRGKLCTIVVQRGTLKKGDILVSGTAFCKVRTLRDADGKILEKVTPGNPAEVEGWKDLPSAGELILQVDSERKARSVVNVRKSKKSAEKMEEDSLAITAKEEQHNKIYKEMLETKRRMGRYRLRNKEPRKKEIIEDDSGIPSLNLIVKSDVDGTLEALLHTLDTYDQPDCELDLTHYSVGAVTEGDVELAKTFSAIIYAFNVDCPKNVQALADESGVVVKKHNVIYKLVDDVKEEINTRLPRKEVEEVIGEASVLQQFDINEGKKKVPVAGSRCVKGVLKKAAMFRLIRDEEILYEGMLSSMRHLKNEVDSVKKDSECGLQLADKNVSFKLGDVLVCYEKKLEARKTNWDPGF